MLSIKKSLDDCSFINKRLALDSLQVQVIAVPDKITISMAVPLEFSTIEKTSEFTVPLKRRRWTLKKGKDTEIEAM